MRYKSVVLLFFLGLLVLPFVSSEVYISKDPLTSYNVGDEVKFTFEVKSATPYYGFVDSDLYCDDSFEKNVFRSSVNLANNGSKSFEVSFFIKTGKECYVQVSFIKDKEKTEKFEVSPSLKSQVYLNSKSFQPGDVLKVNGTLIKENSKDFYYSVLMKLGNVTEKRFLFSTSEFYIEYPFESTTNAGNYSFSLEFEEKDIFGEVINVGFYSGSIKILAKPSSLFVVADEQIKPPFEYSANIQLLDQSKVLIKDEDVLVRLLEPNGRLNLEKIIKSGENFDFSFPSNSEFGGWKIKVIYGPLYTERLVQIDQNKEISIDLAENNTGLVITNRGNIPYEGVLELKMFNGSDEYPELISLNLSIDESLNKKFSKKGEYNLTIGNQTFSNVLITGAVISTNNVIGYGSIGVLLFLLGLIGAFIFTKRKNKDFRKIKKNSRKFFQSKKSKTLENLSSQSPPFSNLSQNSLKPTPKIGVKKRSENKSEKKIYGLFFKDDVSHELQNILRKYGFAIHKFGELSFSMFNSNKNPETKLVKLAKIIYQNSSNKRMFIHSKNFEKSPKFIGSFLDVKEVFSLESKGILISEEIYNNLENQTEFEKVSDFKLKENLIKLYRLKII